MLKNGLFTIIEDAVVIISAGGVFKQVDAYSRGGQIYAQISRGSFVSLRKGGGTSKTSVSWKEITTTNNKPFKYSVGGMEYLEQEK